ncbi:MAG TPA: peptidoglycan-binding domain-containing protein [Dongiaceae bacterium]|nr:peptidoglycan-binding domain-containing protein [Dongiaceae bacterium]
MKSLRPALLALAAAVTVSLGVPAGFSQSKGSAGATSTAPAKTKPTTKAGQPTNGKKKSSKKSSSGSAHAKSAAAPGASSPRSTGKSAAKSSRRSRRQPGQKAPTSDRVNEIQSALARDGSYSGTPTGRWDDGTAAALRKFQASHGLNPSGKLDAPSLQKLGLGSQIAGVAKPTPPPGAVSRLTSNAQNPAERDDSER